MRPDRRWWRKPSDWLYRRSVSYVCPFAFSMMFNDERVGYADVFTFLKPLRFEILRRLIR